MAAKLKQLESYQNPAVKKMEKIRRGLGLVDAEYALKIGLRPATWMHWKTYAKPNVISSQQEALERARKLAEKK